MTLPYRKQIPKTSVYGTFTHPTCMAATTMKLQPNHKRFTATHTNFLSCHVSSRL